MDETTVALNAQRAVASEAEGGAEEVTTVVAMTVAVMTAVAAVAATTVVEEARLADLLVLGKSQSATAPKVPLPHTII